MKLSITVLALLITVSVFANDKIVGVWENSNGKAQVEIYKMNDRYYGRIIRLQEPKDKNGHVKVDKKNPDVKLQTTPIVGLVVMRDLVYDSKDNEWVKGKLYNPEDGRCYCCEIKMKDNNTLDVRGYVGFSLLGKSCTMKRIR